MKLEKVVETITTSLKQDEMVQAIFLKGSMGREEHDEHSDIDMTVFSRAPSTTE